MALTASRREADSLALELDSSISIARSVSACMVVEGHNGKELGEGDNMLALHPSLFL